MGGGGRGEKREIASTLGPAEQKVPRDELSTFIRTHAAAGALPLGTVLRTPHVLPHFTPAPGVSVTRV